jgi:hypothetical protein
MPSVYELRKEATRLNIQGRSKLKTKDELEKAIARHKTSSRPTNNKKCTDGKVLNKISGKCREKCIRGKQIINQKDLIT